MHPQIDPPRVPPPRWLKDWPLPPYRFVPGQPHPLKDPAGHAHGAPDRDEKPERVFLRGVDLFNHRYWWEAHETWEGLWMGLPRDQGDALLLQGLIQWAAALWKDHVGHPDAAQTLLAGARAKIARAEQLGADLANPACYHPPALLDPSKLLPHPEPTP